jgi:hypothetical protein
MDWDPELDVTLSDGRQVVTFQIAAVAGAREAWALVEPRAPVRVIRGCAVALETRQRVDTQIAARLAAGWVPVDRRPAGTPRVPLPPDLVLQISSLLEALARARPALQAADPSGQLWATCQLFRQQAWRFAVGGPRARVARAWRERRLAELAEQRGDLPAARLHYRAALASDARVGVKRCLARLAPPAPTAATAPDRPIAAPGPAPTRPASGGRPRVREQRSRGFATPSPACPPPADSTRLLSATERSCVSGHPARLTTWRIEMNGRIQIVGRLPVELNRRVRAAAKRRKVSLNTFLIDALTHAVSMPPRVAESKGAR